MRHPTGYAATPSRATPRWAALFLPGAVAGGLLGWLLIRPVNWALGKFFARLQRVFDRVTRAYGRVVGWSHALSFVVLLLYAGLLGLTGFGFVRVPTGFIPGLDQGYVIVDMQLPDAASLERTAGRHRAGRQDRPRDRRRGPHARHRRAVGRAERRRAPTTARCSSCSRRSRSASGPTSAPTRIIARLRQRCNEEVESARVSVFPAPPIRGLGNTGGFKLMVEDRGNLGLATLQGQADNLAEKANGGARPRRRLQQLPRHHAAAVPRHQPPDDPRPAGAAERREPDAPGVPRRLLRQRLQLPGPRLAGQRPGGGRTTASRRTTSSSTRSATPRAAWCRSARSSGCGDINGPLTITRYNMYPAAAINGGTLPGVSTGTIIEDDGGAGPAEPAGVGGVRVDRDHLHAEPRRRRGGLRLRRGGGAGVPGAGGAVRVVVAAAVDHPGRADVPAVRAGGRDPGRGSDINIFVQVGFVVLVGLACKNAILIVQFARDRQAEGKATYEAALEAATARLRPIIMTSFAFILGVFPLVIATGAGAEMRRTLGAAVFAGMFGVTFFGIFLTPVFYYVIGWLNARRGPTPSAVQPDLPRGGDPKTQDGDGAAHDGAGRDGHREHAIRAGDAHAP